MLFPYSFYMHKIWILLTTASVIIMVTGHGSIILYIGNQLSKRNMVTPQNLEDNRTLLGSTEYGNISSHE